MNNNSYNNQDTDSISKLSSITEIIGVSSFVLSIVLSTTLVFLFSKNPTGDDTAVLSLIIPSITLLIITSLSAKISNIITAHGILVNYYQELLDSPNVEKHIIKILEQIQYIISALAKYKSNILILFTNIILS